MNWPGDAEHSSLIATLEQLIDELSGMRERIEHRNDVEHAQHGAYADRVRDLSLYLRAVCTLARADLYGAALANLRVALEHVFVDRLVFSGRSYVQLISDVDESTWQEWQSKREAGEAFEQVIEWSRTRKGAVEIHSKGIRSGDPSNEVMLSIYYFLLEQYQPYLGKPSTQGQFDDGITDPVVFRRLAAENADIYQTYLSWKSIKRSLVINGLIDSFALHQIDVHYTFLSAFVHPLSSRVNELLYGRNRWSLPAYDHYVSELIFLYCIALAVMELRHFKEGCTTPPVVDIENWRSTESRCDEAWAEVSYLWFPGHRPHELDRVEQANRQRFRWLKRREGPAPPAPDDIPDTEVRYYRDPLRRLARMHSGFNELLGYSYASDWFRRDAQSRW